MGKPWLLYLTDWQPSLNTPTWLCMSATHLLAERTNIISILDVWIRAGLPRRALTKIWSRPGDNTRHFTTPRYCKKEGMIAFSYTQRCLNSIFWLLLAFFPKSDMYDGLCGVKFCLIRSLWTSYVLEMCYHACCYPLVIPFVTPFYHWLPWKSSRNTVCSLLNTMCLNERSLTH